MMILSLDRNGSAKKGNLEDHSFKWIHMGHTEDEWLRSGSNLHPIVVDALLAEDARPRCFTMDQGMLVILRGVNLNPGRDPEDMVSIRVWLEPERIITVSRQNVLAVEDICKKFELRSGPISSADFLFQLADRLAHRISNFVLEIDEAVDDLEDEVLNHGNRKIRGKISDLRRQIIHLRRYLVPQREVMLRLQSESNPLITEHDRVHLREVSDRIIRHLEDMESAKERAAITQDELESRVNAQMNKTMYTLSIITAIFLPLGFITGLFGTNVAGLPGLQNPQAFIVLCIAMIVISFIQMLIFKLIKWI